MKMPFAIVLIVGVIAITVFILSRPFVSRAILFSPAGQPIVHKALHNYTDSQAHAKYFLLLIRQHRYPEARSVMTPDAKKSLSVAALQSQWVAFEGIHGKITHWTEAGGNNSLLPEYVERHYQIYNSQGMSSLVTLRLRVCIKSH